jgi:hypothetical protein
MKIKRILEKNGSSLYVPALFRKLLVNEKNIIYSPNSFLPLFLFCRKF